MKICLFSPYIPKHIGGGERYIFDVALTLVKNHQVFVAIPANQFSENETVQQEIRERYEAFLGESLSAISFISTPLGTDASWFEKIWWTKQWDVLYYLTDGSLFFSLAKKNILHIQFPFKLAKSSVLEKLKLANWQVKNTNSTFTKNVVEPAWPVTITVVHQPQIQPSLSANQVADVIAHKQNYIIHVGRFFRQLHSKRQDVIVNAFRQLRETHPKLTTDWKLILIGSVEDESYLDEIRAKAKGLPVQIITQTTRKELLEWYQKASIYWHATGFEIDQNTHPEKVEHFGISTGEAMSFACAPVVINKGGQPEVVGPDLADLLWNTLDECVATTAKLLSDKKLLQKKQLQAHQAIQRFSPTVFATKLEQMIQV